MPIVVLAYQQNRRDYLEVCPLDKCKHEVGRKVHSIFEFPKGADRAAFIAEALVAVADKDE